METVKLERNRWHAYFDQVSKVMQGSRVDIEVAALSLGAQPAARWLPLLGVTYDPHDDLIAIMAEGLDHMIRSPREVFIQTRGLELLSMEVIDADGASRIVRFREPLMLPPP